MAYQPATATSVPNRPPGVAGAATVLIVSGAVSFVCAVLWIALGLSVLHDEVTRPDFDYGDTIAYTLLLSPVLTVFLAPVTILAGAQLLRRRNRMLVMAGSVLAVVPLTSCCLLAGVPGGIYALVVLRRPQTVAWYRGAGAVSPPDPYRQYGQYGPWG